MDGTTKDTIILSWVAVVKDKKGKNIGTKVMDELIGFADKNKLRIALTPATDDGSEYSEYKLRLIKFYKKFGFKEYKGSKFKFKEPMIREPQ